VKSQHRAARDDQMRSFGTTLNTSVQADRQGPSIHDALAGRADLVEQVDERGPTLPGPGCRECGSRARAGTATA